MVDVPPAVIEFAYQDGYKNCKKNIISTYKGYDVYFCMKTNYNKDGMNIILKNDNEIRYIRTQKEALDLLPYCVWSKNCQIIEE